MFSRNQRQHNTERLLPGMSNSTTKHGSEGLMMWTCFAAICNHQRDKAQILAQSMLQTELQINNRMAEKWKSIAVAQSKFRSEPE